MVRTDHNGTPETNVLSMYSRIVRFSTLAFAARRCLSFSIASLIKDLPHNGALIDLSNEDLNQPEAIEKTLQSALAECNLQNKGACWLHIPIAESAMIPIAYSEGFKFHHTTPMEARLVKWLQNTPSKVPEYATHQLGVGAVVINDNNEILCVRELRNAYSKWKLPGGLADLGEDIFACAEREVAEETGIEAEGLSLISLRHTHNMQFGRSDMYIIARLKPKPNQKPPVAQEGEIAACEWIPFEEYRRMVQPDGESPHPMMAEILQVVAHDNDVIRKIIPSIVPGRKPSPIYIPQKGPLP